MHVEVGIIQLSCAFAAADASGDIMDREHRQLSAILRNKPSQLYDAV